MQTGIGQRPRRSLAGLAALASLFVFALSANVLPAALIRAAFDLGVTPQRLAMVASVQFLGFFLTTLVGGVICDHVGKKRGLQAACILIVSGAAAWLMSHSFSTACAAGWLMGMGGGVLESMSSALLTDLYPRRRKFYLNLSQVVYCAGAVAGPALMGALMPRGVHWKIFFLAIALLAAMLFGLYAAASVPAPASQGRIPLRQAASALRRRTVLVPCAAIFAYVLAESCVILFVNLHLSRCHGAPENWAIYAISLIWLTMTVGRILCAAVPEEASYEKLLAALLTASALSLVLQGWYPGWRSSLAGFCLTGLLFSGIWPLLVGLASARHPDQSGTVVGIVVAAGSLGCVTAPPLMRWLLELNPRAAFGIAGIPLVITAALLLRVNALPPKTRGNAIRRQSQRLP